MSYLELQAMRKRAQKHLAQLLERGASPNKIARARRILACYERKAIEAGANL